MQDMQKPVWCKSALISGYIMLALTVLQKEIIILATILDMNREGTLPYNCVIYNHIFSILFRLQTVYGLQVKSHFENVVCMISQ